MTPELDQAFETFVATLNADGLRHALATLVERTDYRFIGLWRFQDGKANAAVHFDRENPEVLSAQEVSEDATYCCYVREARQPFTTADARGDVRLAQHPARDEVLTYCGVPVMDSAGHVLGTLCHYDVVPRDPAQVDLELMLNVAGFLALEGRVPPFPRTSPSTPG